MNYKAYTQEPHSALVEIKKAFDEEKSYKAQSICLTYFTYLENQKHIQKALDYAQKDDVYKYLLNHMKAVSRGKTEENIDNFKREIENIRKEQNELATIMKAVEQFCLENNLDTNGLLTKYLPKQIKDMTAEELVKLNKSVTEKQVGKVAKSESATPMPIGEEYEKLMKEAAEFNVNSANHLEELINSIESELEN